MKLPPFTKIILKDTLSIVKRQINYVCKIIKNSEDVGTGLLCKIPYQNSSNFIHFLIIFSNNLIKDDLCEGKDLIMTFSLNSKNEINYSLDYLPIKR